MPTTQFIYLTNMLVVPAAMLLLAGVVLAIERFTHNRFRKTQQLPPLETIPDEIVAARNRARVAHVTYVDDVEDDLEQARRRAV